MSTMILKFSVHEGGRIQLSPEMRNRSGRDEIWSTHREVCRQDLLIKLSQRMVDELREARGLMGACETAADLMAPRSYLQKMLQPLGHELCAMVLPEEFLEDLRRASHVRHLIFEYDPTLNCVPFECLFLWGDFVCFHYAVGRRLRSQRSCEPARGRGLPYQAAGIIAPGGTFPDAITSAFKRFKTDWINAGHERRIDFSNTSVARPADLAAFQEMLRSFEMVSLLCHYVYDDANPELSGYVLDEGSSGNPRLIFSAQELIQTLGPGHLPPLLLFSLCCESAMTKGWENAWPNRQGIYGMVDAALRCGVRHYIGALIEYPMFRAVQVFQPFYEALIGGFTVGEALRRARLSLRQDPDDPWDGGTVLALCLVLYNDPSEAYFCASGHRADQAATRLCEQPAQGGRCDKVVCSEDPGFKQCRCSEHCIDEDSDPATCSAGHQLKSNDELSCCSVRGCHNTVCSACPAAGERLCWKHACQRGHPIIAGVGKECPGPHPEKRSVCPLDEGWMRGWCDTCLSNDHER